LPDVIFIVILFVHILLLSAKLFVRSNILLFSHCCEIQTIVMQLPNNHFVWDFVIL